MITAGTSLKHLARFVNGNPFKPEDLEAEAGFPVIRIRQLLDENADVDLAAPPGGAVWLRDGDLVLSWSATLAVRVWNRGPALLNQHLYRVDPSEGVHKGWLRYILEVGVERLRPLMHGSAMTHITQEMLWSVTASVPPYGTQQAIAEFLDSETGRIDALIAKNRRLIELLDARSTSQREALVTGPGIPTGIPSLGTVPPTWEVLRNKVFLREVNDPSPDGSGEMLSVSHLTGVTPRSEKTVYMFEAESTVGYKRVQPGDLVINTMWAWMGAAGVSTVPGIVSPAYGVYRFHSNRVLPEYYEILIRAPGYIEEMTRFSRGVTSSRLRLYPDEFLRLRAPVPPIEVQRDLVADFTSWASRKVILTDRLARQIDLLVEHRQALITAAVTGELPVPGVAA